MKPNIFNIKELVCNCTKLWQVCSICHEEKSKKWIKAKAIRTNCYTGKGTEVDIVVERVWHGSNLNSWWIEIIKGVVTGYESIKIRDDIIERTSKTGWHACMGTERRWDTLFIPPEEMKKIWQSVKADPVSHKDDGFYFSDETWTTEYGPFETEEECRKECTKYANECLG